ncbi:hypothetical protein R4227_14955 [Gordonia amicalis]|uniref:hypothetical protein n=1 Tax=Gordonia amicalis TaxID=89053 RepID=UPI002954C2D4|nr:hypothetical protein [Gordonia amicalis]MDV7101384.1 hypothetical protein [Gordonia amicalis]MDV7173981.1 hypothetical protein [Gordonia amicalis]
MVTVVEIDRWDAEQVREVFRQTEENIRNCDTMVTRFANLTVFETWSGDSADAAGSRVATAVKDFTNFRNESAAIGMAARKAAESIDEVKRRLEGIREGARQLGLTVTDSGTVDGPTPSPSDTTFPLFEVLEFISKKERLQEQLSQLLADAAQVDQDLATVIDAADGDLPVTDVDPITGTSSISRRANQTKVFEDRFGRSPSTPSDWKLAEAMDPNTYDPRYMGTDSAVIVKSIDKVPGGGLVRVNAFIPRDNVHNIPHDNAGDSRGFDGSAGAEDSRVSIYIDYDNGVVVMRQNPSVEIPSGAVKVGSPTLGVAQDGERVQVTFEAKDPFMPFYDQEVGKWASSTVEASVRGTLVAEPYDGVEPRLEGQLTNYPAWEVYVDSDSGVPTQVYGHMPDPTDPWGPVKHLPGHHDVKVGGN